MSSMAELKALSIAASATTSNGTRDSATCCPTPDNRTKANILINQLMLAMKGRWVPGGFCFTHGHGVGPVQIIKTCNKKTKEGETGDHNNNATRAQPSGPGRNKNKDWDKFFL